MSQRSKKKSNILFTIFISLLILSSIGITYFLITKHNSSKLFNTKNIFKFQSVSRKDPVSVFKQYPINPIDITNNETELSIKGLKNKEIEDKINKKLKELKNGNKYCYVTFNVSNVFSVYCDNQGIALDLNTGNDIILEEVYQRNSDLNNILMSSFYESICNWDEYCRIPNEYSKEWIDEYNNNIENKLVDNFKKIYKNNYSFAIGYQGLHMFLNNNDWTSINYYNSPNEITIFDRFLNNNNIYENKVSNYCEVQSCYNLTDLYNVNNKDLYLKYYYLNDKTYITSSIFNYTNYDLLKNKNRNINKTDYDLNSIGEKILNNIIDKYELNKSDNYHNINLNISIYGISNIPYNIVTFMIEDKEFNKDNFIKFNLGLYESKTINSKESFYSNMIIKDNKIEYLDSNPRDYFNNFDETLYKYILDNLKGDDDYESPFYNLCCGAQFSEGYKNTDYKKIIEISNYAVDKDNKLLLMNYKDQIINIPWNIFIEKDNTNEVTQKVD